MKSVAALGLITTLVAIVAADLPAPPPQNPSAEFEPGALAAQVPCRPGASSGDFCVEHWGVMGVWPAPPLAAPRRVKRQIGSSSAAAAAASSGAMMGNYGMMGYGMMPYPYFGFMG